LRGNLGERATEKGGRGVGGNNDDDDDDDDTVMLIDDTDH